MERARDAVDILHRLAGALFIPCACGVTIKVPRKFDSSQVTCPRCGTPHPVPVASAATAAPGAAPTPGIFRYTPGRWQSFRCACGNTIQLSPAHQATRVHCSRCNATIQTVRT